MSKQGAGSPVRREGCIAPFAEPRLIDVDRPATGTSPIIGEGLHAFVGEVFVESWVAVIIHTCEVMQSHIPSPTIIGVVSREQVHLRTDGHLKNVASPGRVDF